MNLVSRLLHKFKATHQVIARYCDQKTGRLIQPVQKLKKVVAVKRSFNAEKTSSKVLEAKSAERVMKQLNWEFKHLFGPLRNPKTKPRDCQSFDSDTQVTHNSQYHLENVTNGQDETFDLNVLLDFPMLNKSPTQGNFALSNPLNLLRQQLQKKCVSTFPSVSRILERTMPEESKRRLENWKTKMINELGEEEFKKHQEETLEAGNSLHNSINSYLSLIPGSEVHVAEKNAGHWRSLQKIFPHIVKVKLLEEKITHPFLCYQGIVDCFAQYREHLVVIDWKTSKKSKTSLSSTFDNPLQIAAYVGALNFDPKLQYLASKGLIAVAYEDGAPASELFIDESLMVSYWQQWLSRLKLYWETQLSETSSQH